MNVCGVPLESAAQHHAAAEAEGVIVLFSRHVSSSFAAARNALQSASTSAEVQLCVANHATAHSGEYAGHTCSVVSRPNVLSLAACSCLPRSLVTHAGDDAASAAAQEWAAEQLFEYVEVHTADADADAALELDGGAFWLTQVKHWANIGQTSCSQQFVQYYVCIFMASSLLAQPGEPARAI